MDGQNPGNFCFDGVQEDFLDFLNNCAADPIKATQQTDFRFPSSTTLARTPVQSSFLFTPVASPAHFAQSSPNLPQGMSGCVLSSGSQYPPNVDFQQSSLPSFSNTSFPPQPFTNSPSLTNTVPSDIQSFSHTAFPYSSPPPVMTCGQGQFPSEIIGSIDPCISPDPPNLEDPFSVGTQSVPSVICSGPPSNSSSKSPYGGSPAPDLYEGNTLVVNHLEARDINIRETSIPLAEASYCNRSDCGPIERMGSVGNVAFKVTVKNPKTCYNKVQRRIGNESQQRIQDGMIDVEIVSTHSVSQVDAFVMRDPKIAAKAKDKNGKVLLKSQRYEKASCVNARCQLGLNLDDKYSIDGTRLVYKLAQNNTKELNMFQLLLDLQFYDIPDKAENFFLFDFLLKSQVTVGGNKSHKRARLNNGREREIENVEKLAIEHLTAKVATFDKIVGHDFSTSTTLGDIGYFFEIHGHSVLKKFKEGDVIVFIEDEDGNVKIELLTNENLSVAVLAGVITRRAYVQARRPGDWQGDYDQSEGFDVVCVIGMVPVRIKGEVQCGERIYTSEEEGTAVSESQLDGDDDDQPIWLGFAMQSNTEKSSKLVDCFVSILLGMTDQKMETATRAFRKKFIRRLDGLENAVQGLEQGHRDLEESVNDIRRSNRGCKIKVSVALIMLAVLGVMGYIFLAPSSPYVKMKCKEGSEKGSLSFEFRPEADEEIPIIGLQFEWNVLKKKLDLNFDRMDNDTDVRYFLNKYRCETGQIRRVTSWLDPSPQLPRNNVLAVDKGCNNVYYYSKKDNKWYAYSENEISNIRC